MKLRQIRRPRKKWWDAVRQDRIEQIEKVINGQLLQTHVQLKNDSQKVCVYTCEIIFQLIFIHLFFEMTFQCRSVISMAR